MDASLRMDSEKQKWGDGWRGARVGVECRRVCFYTGGTDPEERGVPGDGWEDWSSNRRSKTWLGHVGRVHRLVGRPSNSCLIFVSSMRNEIRSSIESSGEGHFEEYKETSIWCLRIKQSSFSAFLLYLLPRINSCLKLKGLGSCGSILLIKDGQDTLPLVFSFFAPHAGDSLLITGHIPAEHRVDLVQSVPEQEPIPFWSCSEADVARPLPPPVAPRRRGSLGHLLGSVLPHRWLWYTHRPSGGHGGPAQTGWAHEQLRTQCLGKCPGSCRSL